eukprot:NODE_6620_length_516_cov_82.380463_g6454_i0.p1 GENE.NODE_6620_length_516_cov_82.380463_g6454_i0~~NODE_6620_length_516_cov_82.380463_g6454_i0.p1  ORF type:complete len:122 (-),score=8.13 NODE_6620_length_516_cov_82.380463_g6454_i0:78-443(-)
MAWSAYVDNLCQYPNVAKAALLGHDGSVWAQSAGLNITEGPIWAPQFGPKLLSTGVTLGGEKFFVVKGETDVVCGKKGNVSLSIFKTGQCLVLGIGKEGSQPPELNNDVEAVAKYLMDQGY